jgi:hypothetical protein
MGRLRADVVFFDLVVTDMDLRVGTAPPEM